MTNILIQAVVGGVFFGIVVGLIVGLFRKRPREILKRVQDDKGGIQNDKGGIRDDKPENIISEQKEHRDENLAKLREFVAGMKTQSDSSASSGARITNDQVEKMLNISNATAERYLNELEKEGLLKQVGKTGKYTYYEKNIT